MIARAAIRNPWVFTEFVDDKEGSHIAFDVNNAQSEYFHAAAKHGTKEKYIDFHRKNFSRLIAATIADNSDFVFPRNIHMN